MLKSTRVFIIPDHFICLFEINLDKRRTYESMYSFFFLFIKRCNSNVNEIDSKINNHLIGNLSLFFHTDINLNEDEGYK